MGEGAGSGEAGVRKRDVERRGGEQDFQGETGKMFQHYCITSKQEPPMYVYSTMLNFGMLPLVEINHMMR